MSISVIIPTVGRPTLERTLASVAPQLEAGDEILVLRDNTGDLGNTPRDKAVEIAHGSHLWFIDDDDIAMPGALAAMRRVATRGVMACFRMAYGEHSEEPGRMLWERKVVEPGNLGTPCALVPNINGLPYWTEANDELIFSDIRFLMKVARTCRDVTWHEDIVAVIRP